MGSRHGGWRKGFGYLSVLLFCFAAHAGARHYYHTKTQGTVLVEADARNPVPGFEYSPYGHVATSVVPTGPRYAGYVHDPEIGVVYMQARHYSPITARFPTVASDTSSRKNSFRLSRYAYVEHPTARWRSVMAKISVYVSKAPTRLSCSSSIVTI
mgnify:CR=1 FL=1